MCPSYVTMVILLRVKGATFMMLKTLALYPTYITEPLIRSLVHPSGHILPLLYLMVVCCQRCCITATCWTVPCLVYSGMYFRQGAKWKGWRILQVWKRQKTLTSLCETALWVQQRLYQSLSYFSETHGWDSLSL